MMQVLMNLLSNAIKFSKPRSQIYIEAIEVPSQCTETHKQIEINLVDQGIGMTEEQMKPLFKPFYKVETSESKEMNPNGVGLGLHISKNIAKKLNGDITYSSEMGIGSCFTFCLNL